MSQFGIPLARCFPLRLFPQDILVSLCRSLWGWEHCPRCANTGECSKAKCTGCPWSIQLHLKPFRLFYLEITYQYTPEDLYNPSSILKDHIALLDIVAFIQHHPQKPRRQLLVDYFGSNETEDLTDANKNQAFDLALSILSMVPFAESNLCLDRNIVDGPETWAEHQSASDVVALALPIGKPLSKEERCAVSQTVSAASLEEQNLAIIRTDDFRQHLEYDSTVPGVYVFFHPGFLRGHLSFLHSSSVADDRTALSQQVVLETMYTLRYILFDWEDPKNSAIASRVEFNLDDLRMNMSSYSGLSLNSKQYRYWGRRLLLLAKTLEDAKMRNQLRARAERYKRGISAAMVVLTLIVAVVSAILQSREGGSDVVLAIALNGTSLATTALP